MKKFYFFLSLVIAALTANAATVTDVFSKANVSGLTTGFNDVSYTAESGNYYKGRVRLASATSDVLLFSGNASMPSGVVVSDIKDGELRKITVDWNGSTANSFVMEVYGAEYAFSYNAMFKDEVDQIGTITKSGDSDSFEVPAQYKYVGIRPAGGFAYVDDIKFEYEVESATPTFTLKYNEEGGEVRVINTKTGQKLANGQVYEIEAGTSLSCFASANLNYVIEEYAINGVAVEAAAGQSYYLGEVVMSDNTVLDVTFKSTATTPEYTLACNTEGNGTVSFYDSSFQSVTPGKLVAGTSLYIIPVAEGGNYIESFTINGVEATDENGQTANGKITLMVSYTIESDTEVNVVFKSDSEPSEYTLTYTVEGNGNLTIVDTNWSPIFSSPAKIAAGTQLLMAPVPEEGNVIESFTVNGVEAVDEDGETAVGKDEFRYYYTVNSDVDVKLVFKAEAPAGYCNNYEGMNSSSSRYLGNVTLTCGDETLTVSTQNRGNQPIYFDKSDEVLEITPGSSVNIKCTDTTSEWMHGYAWVDWNRDYVFTPEFDGNAVTANSELVVFNYYKGYNSNGVATADNANGYLADMTFNVPDDITPGDYRFRYIVAWDNINPCGPELSDKDELRVTGGCILDLTLRYSEPDESGVEAIESAEEVAPVYYNLQGVRVANPANGVYIKVAGEKAEKVYLNK